MVQASEAEVEAAADVEDEAAGGDRPMEPSGAPTASEIRMTPKTAGLDLTIMMTTTETAEGILRNVGSVENLDIFNKTVLFAKRGERQNENSKGASIPRTMEQIQRRNLPTSRLEPSLLVQVSD